MKITYDREADAAYIQLSDLEPDGAVEMKDGVNLDMTNDDQIVGIEILDASKHIPLGTLYRYEFEPEMVEI
ncbi:MAG TPA: DUF2283 domain-containing protein [Candidatus Kapabacteria bacterium]|jgi:uncharacterized protein YuzE|nr:DUF2283 domain-containing protein [Candidatus Kapabacteria bacterium]